MQVNLPSLSDDVVGGDHDVAAAVRPTNTTLNPKNTLTSSALF
jgi:hypothetical protein